MNVLLAAGASVAIYKACDLASKLVQDGHPVKAVLTPAAAKLVSPQLFEALTGERAHVDEFSDAREGAMDHIALADWGELLLVAPASADLLARLALGLGGDLVGTVALAWQHPRPRLLCPAMNPNMLAAAPIARHLETLRGDGWQVIEPEDGHMACGVSGKGRLPDPEAIRRAVQGIAKGFRRAGP
jgi:phosphopantothenoylcysteine decarboxylase/phosphopantothenate--cysteine ligase